MNLEIKKALSFHQKGDLREAEELYLDILSNLSEKLIFLIDWLFIIL